MKTNTQNRLSYFDGIRGLAALIVLNEHFLKIFVPAGYIDQAQWPTRSFGWDWLSFPPFNLLGNGAPAVTIFFVISGWVLSHYIYHQERIHLVAEGVKRYLRLMIPCLASLILIYGVTLIGDFGAKEFLGQIGSKEQTFRSFEMGFLAVLEQGIWRTLLIQDFSLNPALWTLTTELYGAAIIFVLAYMWTKMERGGFFDSRSHKAIQLIIPFGMLFATTTSLLFGIFIGMFLHALTSINAIDSVLRHYRRAWVWLAALLGALLFGYMIRGSFQNPYIHISFWGMSMIYEYAYNAIGAGLIILAIHYSPGAQKILTKTMLLWLGKISFSLYLTHFIVLMTIGTSLGSLIGTGLTSIETALIGVAVIPCSFVVAAAFQKLVDAPSIKLASACKEKLIRWRGPAAGWTRPDYRVAKIAKD